MDDVTECRAELLNALAQPTRFKIVELLRDGVHCICEIIPAIGEEQSSIGSHLNQMLACGILSRSKKGQNIYYGIKHPGVLAIVDLRR